LAGSRERERRRARERYERQQAARVARARKLRKRFGIGLAVVCVLGLIGGLTAAFAGGSTPAATTKPKTTASASPSASATASAAAVTEPATHCTYTTSGVAPAVKKVSAPSASPDYKATYTAAINTNVGTIDINLLNSKATCTVNSFVHLAEAGYFNASQCHRIVNSDGLYVLQCGDPTATATTKLTCSTASNAPGTGGPGYEFESENLPTGASSAGTVTYKAGTVAMANSGSADTNGSQFFLVFKNSTLTPDYTPFGTITSGLDILQKVAKAGTSCTYADAGGGAPKEKVVINSVTIKQT
jgi:peptidyl-prolyl cis-trans isomerase B (cyclophilin B)